MAQPRRDSKSLGEDAAGSSPARSLSSALRPSLFRSAASIVKPGLNEGVQFEHGKTFTKPGCSPLQLSADSSEGQTCSLHNSASAIPANVSLDSSSNAAAMPVPSGLPQDTKPDRQAAPVEDPEHQHDQVHSLIRSLPGPCIAFSTHCCSKLRTRDSTYLSPAHSRPSMFLNSAHSGSGTLHVTVSLILCFVNHALVWCQCICTEGQCAESETGCPQNLSSVLTI